MICFNFKSGLSSMTLVANRSRVWEGGVLVCVCDIWSFPTEDGGLWAKDGNGMMSKEGNFEEEVGSNSSHHEIERKFRAS